MCMKIPTKIKCSLSGSSVNLHTIVYNFLYIPQENKNTHTEQQHTKICIMEIYIKCLLLYIIRKLKSQFINAIIIIIHRRLRERERKEKLSSSQIS